MTPRKRTSSRARATRQQHERKTCCCRATHLQQFTVSLVLCCSRTILLVQVALSNGQNTSTDGPHAVSKATLPNTRARKTDNNREEEAIKVAAQGNAASLAGIGGTNIAAYSSRSPNPGAFEFRTANDDGIIPLHRSNQITLHQQGPVHKCTRTLPTDSKDPSRDPGRRSRLEPTWQRSVVVVWTRVERVTMCLSTRRY